MLKLNHRRSLRIITIPDLLRIITLAFAFCIAATYTFASEPQASKPISDSVLLQEDKRLDSPLTLTERNIQLDELLPRLSTKGLRLEADRSCARQKVQLRLKQRSLRTLMQALAELLPGEWVALEKDRGYVLRMKQKSIQKRTDWWQLFELERERALAALRIGILKAMRSEREPLHSEFGPERDPSISDKQEAEMDEDHQFFRNLPAGLQERIANQINENGTFDRGGISNHDEEGATVISLHELPSDIQESVRAKISSGKHNSQDNINWDNVSLEFLNGGTAVMVNYLTPGNHGPGSLFGGAISSSKLYDTSMFTRPEGVSSYVTNEPFASAILKDAPIGWKQLFAYQHSTVWKNDPPPTKIFYSEPPYRSDMLEWVGEKSDIEFVADFYAKPGFVMRPEERAKPLPAPLKLYLDTQAAMQDISWKKRDDNLYLFRNNRWYRDDYMEVPNATLRHFLNLVTTFDDSSVKKDPGYHPTPLQYMYGRLNRHAEMVSVLSPWQIGHGLRNYAPAANEPFAKELKIAGKIVYASDGNYTRHMSYVELPFTQDTSEILQYYHTIQFYAGLDETRRKALLQNRLEFESLSAVQKQQVAYLLPTVISALKQSDYPVVLGLTPNYQGSDRTTMAVIHLSIISPPQ